MNLVEKSLEIATKAHENQKRRDGKTPYITHPIAVKDIVLNQLNLFFDKTKTHNYSNVRLIDAAYRSVPFQEYDFIQLVESVALLHDAWEDNENFTLEYILGEFYKENFDHNFLVCISKSLDALTHRKNETYLDYILRAKKDEISRIIKIADIEHNISTRNGSNTAGEIKKDELAIQKYQLARYILLN